MNLKPHESTPTEADLIEELTRMTLEVRGLRRELAELRRLLPVSDTVTAADIARKLGLSQSALYKPWNLPNFGRSDVGSSPRRWFRDKAMAWYDRPEEDRRREWESLPEHVRAAV